MGPLSSLPRPGQFLPPSLQSRRVQLKNLVPLDRGRWRGKVRHAIVDAPAILRIRAGQQMPQRECIADTRLGENHVQGEGSSALEIEAGEGARQDPRRIFEIRRSWPYARTCVAHRSGRYQ